MQLKDFVQNTIVELVEAVEAAQAELEERATINPFLSPNKGEVYHSGYSAHEARQKIETLRFDVAVTAGEGGKSGKAGIQVAGVSFGGEVDIPASSQSTSRIQFSVDLVLPPKQTPNAKVKSTRGKR